MDDTTPSQPKKARTAGVGSQPTTSSPPNEPLSVGVGSQPTTDATTDTTKKLLKDIPVSQPTTAATTDTTKKLPKDIPVSQPTTAATTDTTKKLLKDIPVLTPTRYEIHQAVLRRASAAYLEEHGYVVVDPWESDEVKDAFRREVVRSVWEGIMDANAMPSELRARVPTTRDEATLDAFMDVLPRNLVQQLKDSLGTNPYLGCGFGAPATNSAFNNPGAWQLRQSAVLALFASEVLESPSVHFSLDRVVCKFHGMGMSEWLHLDKQQFSPVQRTHIHGKYVATDGNFICVPGSHKWSAEIKELYEQHYKKSSAMKWAIDPTKPDPLDLFGKARKVIVPAGCLVFWRTDTVHGVVKNTTGKVAFGFYLGYSTDIGRELYEQKLKVSEICDRHRVWRYGVAPKGYPSIDKVHVYPNMFVSRNGILANFIAQKMDQSSPHWDYSTRLNKTTGNQNAHLVENDPVGYTPPPLSALGREMLVGAANVHRYDFDFIA
ncbi:hypothetical protein T484DRAFT_1757410 [Baffinella frigidus]|nr:hypothetical protein T484DRAFT_1757410 [Cryptophyta sp. CCMP2293]